MDETEKFLELMNTSLRKLPQEIGMAFSGGLDSSVLGKMLVDAGFRIRGYVTGMKNSRDIVQARKVAKEIGLKLEVIELNKEDIEKAIPLQRDILQKVYDKTKKDRLIPNPIPISFNLPLYFVAKHSREKNLVISQGPDEMLGGYTRHIKLGKREAEEEMRKNTEAFLKEGVLQNIYTIDYFGKKAFFPFLDKEIVSFCLSLPYELKIKQGSRKHILRKLGEKIGLSEEVCNQAKKAAQYGSGIIWEMKRLAKERGVHISRYVREAR